ERRLFFFALVMGAAVFNLLHTFLGGVLIFAALYAFARWATKTDPQILRLLLNSARARTQYDPMKFMPVRLRRNHHVLAEPSIPQLRRSWFIEGGKHADRLHGR